MSKSLLSYRVRLAQLKTLAERRTEDDKDCLREASMQRIAVIARQLCIACKNCLLKLEGRKGPKARRLRREFAFNTYEALGVAWDNLPCRMREREYVRRMLEELDAIGRAQE
ncbi:MAG: hypothetical protein WC698_05295 [Candidatus Peribacteraceae bacterium]